MDTAILILAGGEGKRLWPLSRKEKPKQFLSIGKDGRSFFEMTVSRALKIVDSSRIFILTQKEYQGFVEKQAPTVLKENIFCDIKRKNTAPAIVTALMKIRLVFTDVISVVLPADHYVKDEEDFIETVKKGIHTAKKENSFVMIGIPPVRAETSFGYIKCAEAVADGVYKAERFTEKPSAERAEEFVRDGRYFWNSGMIIGKMSFFLEQYKTFLPEVFNCAEKIFETSKEDEEKIYDMMPNVSIDYGILEKTQNILLLKGLFGWDDVGSWSALERICATEQNSNAVSEENN